MKISEFFSILDSLTAPEIQADYDNSGVQLEFGLCETGPVLLALDIDHSVIDEAESKDCNAIITHHPLYFKPLRRILSDDPNSDMTIRLINNQISVYAAHTNLDRLYFDKLGAVLSFEPDAPLLKREEYNKFGETGFGSISQLFRPVSLSALLKMVKEKLELDYLQYTGNVDWEIKSVALLNGAGGNSIEKIIQTEDVDCIITGDVGYHQIKYARDYSVAIIDAGHFGTEKKLLVFLRDEIMRYLTKNMPDTEIKLLLSKQQSNPFNLYNGTKNE